MLYSEGQAADHIYFIISGEFKLTKKIILLDKKLNEKSKQTLETKLLGKNEIRRNSKAAIDLVVLTKHSTLGDEDALLSSDQEAKRFTSCICVSNDAVVYELRADEFMRECRKQACFNDVMALVRKKREKFH